MFLKAFKEKSNRKYINKLLDIPKAAVNNNKVKTIAVLLNANEYDDFESFRLYFKELNLTSPKHKVVAFVNDDKYESSQWETYFSPKDFGWKGKLNNIDLQSFVDEDYDVLISFYKQESLELNLITALSKANLRYLVYAPESGSTECLTNIKKKIKLSFAESCTGGLLSSLITSFPNSSKIFVSGFVTYSNLSKQKMLGVKNKTLIKYGAVSKEVAREMVNGAWKKNKVKT